MRGPSTRTSRSPTATPSRFGDARITALATPGHRPEHMAFLIADAGRGDTPWLAVTGDSLFVGDLARPDLAVEAEEGAHGLFRSLRRLLALDDFAEVWPGHIGGSLCGGAGMSQKPGSTIGFERRYNRLAKLEDEGEFVRALTGTLAPQPPNFTRIVALNRGPLLTTAATIETLAPARVKDLLEAGATLIDGRDPRAFDSDHVAGAINVTMIRAAVGTRAAWVVDPASDVVVTAATDEEARRLARLLEAVGFRSIRGLLAGGTQAWLDAGLPTHTIPMLDIPGLAARLRAGDVRLLDVRDDDEWQEGHVEGSTHLPYYELARRHPGRAHAERRRLGNRLLGRQSELDRRLAPRARGRGEHRPRDGRGRRRPRGRGDRARPGLIGTAARLRSRSAA